MTDTGLNILIIAPQPFYEKRGTPLAVSLLAKALSELGHTIDLITYHLGEDHPLPSVTHHRSYAIACITSVKKGFSVTKLFLDIFVFLKAVSLLTKHRYDCIHGVEEGAMMGVILKKVFRVPLVYDMDSSIPEQIRDSGMPLWSCKPIVALVERLERWTIRNSNLVIAVCTALMERVRYLEPDIPVATLEDIPVVAKEFIGLDSAIENIRNELALGNAPCVVYTGTFESYQGITLLLDSVVHVVPRCSNVVFILVGGSAEQVVDIICQAEQRKVYGFMRILGRRPLEEMPVFMNLADVLVSPRSMGCNTPMKLYSYLQSGRPVVATRLHTHTQVLNDDVAILADATPESFASAIVCALEDKDLRDRIGAAGAALIETKFTYAAFKEKLEIAYSQIKTC